MPSHLIPPQEAKVGRGVGSGGVHFLGLACGSGLSFSFFSDQFLVLEKKRKTKEREFEIYRKQYQCFVFVVFHLPCIHTLPSLGSLLQLLIQLLRHRFAPATRADSAGLQFLVGIVGNSNLSTCRAPFLVIAHPPLLSSLLLPATH